MSEESNKVMKIQKKALFYNGKEIGYSIYDFNKNKIVSYITVSIGEIQDILKSTKSSEVSIGFKEEME